MLDKICGRWILLFKNTKIQLFGINASHLNILMYKCVEPANLCRTLFFFFFFFFLRKNLCRTWFRRYEYQLLRCIWQNDTCPTALNQQYKIYFLQPKLKRENHELLHKLKDSTKVFTWWVLKANPIRSYMHGL